MLIAIFNERNRGRTKPTYVWYLKIESVLCSIKTKLKEMQFYYKLFVIY